jgi:hypothetical protein
MPKMITIYAIKDCETGEVKYIGQSQNPRKRFWQHIESQMNPVLAEWMEKSIKAGNCPELAEIETVKAYKANERESYYISKHLDTIFNRIVFEAKPQTFTQKILSNTFRSLEFREPKKGELDFFNPFTPKIIKIEDY